MNWIEIITKVLEYREINQKQLAKEAGISNSHLTNIMKGRSKELGFTKGLAVIKLHPNYKELLDA